MSALVPARALRYIRFPHRVPYALGLELQETLVARRVTALDRATPAQPAPNEDLLLLLEHRPVYTAGRRESDEATLAAEGARLRAFGADYVPTQRGGQTTYHGPGQLVGYPIVELNAQNIRTRDFVARIETFLRNLVSRDLGVPTIDSEHTGLFTSSTSKIASIGLQLRHRVTMHGFSLNVEDDVKPWFNHIVACGLADVRATTLESERRDLSLKPRLTVGDVIDFALPAFGEAMDRPMVPLEQEGPVWDIVHDAMRKMEREAAEVN